MINQFLHEGRNGFSTKCFPSAKVFDFAGPQIHPDLVSLLEGIGSFRRFEQGNSLIESVAIKDPGKAFGNDARNSRHFQDKRRMFSRGSATEVLSSDQNVSRLYLLDEFRSLVLQGMFSQLYRVDEIEVSGGNDRIRINI